MTTREPTAAEMPETVKHEEVAPRTVITRERIYTILPETRSSTEAYFSLPPVEPGGYYACWAAKISPER